MRIAATVVGLIHPNDRDAVVVKVQCLDDGGPTLVFVIRCRTPRGAFVAPEWKAVPESVARLIHAPTRVIERATP